MPGYRALSNSFICQTRSTRHAIVMFQHVAADAICLQGQRKRQVQSQARLEPWDKHKAIIQNQIGVHQYIQYVCYVKQQCWTNMQIMQASSPTPFGTRGDMVTDAHGEAYLKNWVQTWLKTVLASTRPDEPKKEGLQGKG